jgi:hypothetical protein
LKSIDIWGLITQLIEDQSSWIEKYDDPAKLIEEIEMVHIINLDTDVVTKISKKPTAFDKESHLTYFIFESGYVNKTLDRKKKDLGKSYKENMGYYFKNSTVKDIEHNCIGLKDYHNKSVTMNRKYIFF